MSSEGHLRSSRRSWKTRMLAVYLVLLLASHLYRWWASSAAPKGDGFTTATVGQVDGECTNSSPVRLAYLDLQPARPDAPVVIILHGSPIKSFDLKPLAEMLAADYRVILPDLPGFGKSG